MKLENDLIVLDLETTGTWVEKDKIVEIALIKLKTDGTRIDYLKRFNPGLPIPPVVVELISINNEDVKNEPFFKERAQEIIDFMDGCDLAGFNLERFDLPLLERELNESGYKFSWREMTVIDAQKVYHINQKRDLTAAYEFYCNKPLVNAHSALADAAATLEILEAQAVKYIADDPSIKALNQFNYTKTAEFFDDDRKFRWWNGKLYMMFGKYARQYSLQELVKRDPRYCEWILSASFSEEIKHLIENALKGQFPNVPT